MIASLTVFLVPYAVVDSTGGALLRWKADEVFSVTESPARAEEIMEEIREYSTVVAVHIHPQEIEC